MLAVLSWWVIMQMLGLLALPLALRLFRHLPERGYAFAKPLGLLLCGYLLWIGATFGFLSNSRSAILFAMLVVGVVSALVWQRDRRQMSAFLRENRRVIIATELLFAVAFAGWALVRAYNPEISATEKPMEIAFLNAILRSETFPPHDPWLSGFGISYYYFGYLMVAVVTKLSGVAASVAFNLAIALLFALTVTGSFSVVYNLVAVHQRGREARRSESVAGPPTRRPRKSVASDARGRLSAVLWALLGPLFVVVIGNLEGLLEMLHTRGLGSPAFWKWLDIQGLAEAPVNGRWFPTDMWWWWRASRVVNDRDLYGSHMEVIDEFPQFSFLLGDMHPHVLALPFVLLAVALALNVLLGASEWLPRERRRRAEAAAAPATAEADAKERRPRRRDKPPTESSWKSRIAGWFQALGQSFTTLWRKRAADILLLALCLGSLGFLNTWDLPIHLFVVMAAFFVGQRAHGQSDSLVHTATFAASVAVPAFVFYLPFYLGFQSQAGGVLPVLFNVTRISQYLIMFGLFVFVIVSMIGLQLARAISMMPAEERRRFPWDILNWFLWLVAGPLLLIVLAALSVTVTTNGKQFLQGLLADERVKALVGSSGILGLIRQALLMRLTNPWTFLLVALCIACLIYLLLRSWNAKADGAESEAATAFAYLMAGTAFLLTLGVEFVYLRDSFGTRMNTVFKFYYQAWVMMGLSAAFGVYYLLAGSRKKLEGGEVPAARRVDLRRGLWAVPVVALVLIGLVYPAVGIPSKAGDFKGEPTLDGMAFIKNVRGDDYAAMKWLQENVKGMAYIVESTGGSYTETSWVSAFTGLPTILGWDFHEHQWRGNSTEANKRRPDIAQIYQNQDANQVLALLDKYDVQYVYLGPVERSKYELPPNVGERLGRFLERVYEGGSVSIYRR